MGIEPAGHIVEDRVALGLVEHLVVQALVDAQGVIGRPRVLVHPARRPGIDEQVDGALEREQRQLQESDVALHLTDGSEHLGGGARTQLAEMDQGIVPIRLHHRGIAADGIEAEGNDR